MERLRKLDAALAKANALQGPLRAQLGVLQSALQGDDPAIDRACQRFIERVENSLDGRSVLDVGDVLPAFVLPNDSGGLTSLADVLESGPAVVSFNRGHWCHQCMLELFALARIYPKVRSLGGTIVSIIPERQQYSQSLKARCKLPFPVLSDMDNSFGLSVGLVVSAMADLRDIYLEQGVDLAAFQGAESWSLPIPATFLIDRDGTIKARYVDPDYTRRMEPDEILAALEDLQRTGFQSTD